MSPVMPFIPPPAIPPIQLGFIPDTAGRGRCEWHRDLSFLNLKKFLKVTPYDAMICIIINICHHLFIL